MRFSPDETGEWHFQVSFRKGPKVAISLDSNVGESASFDGDQGSFVIKPQDASAPGFLKWGRLEYVGKHYLKFRDGSYWIKGGELVELGPPPGKTSEDWVVLIARSGE